MRKELVDRFATQPLAAWTEFFDGIDCCVTPVLTLAEAREHKLFKNEGDVMSSTVIGNGKVAIITGASAGIGKASAVALLKAGYSGGVRRSPSGRAWKRRLPPPARTPVAASLW